MSRCRFVLLNARTLYPVAEITGQPVAEPARRCQSCDGMGRLLAGYPAEGPPIVECPRCGGSGIVRQKAITVRAETQAGAALEILETWGFSVEPCCDPRVPDDYVCDACRIDDEERAAGGRL